MRKNFLSLVIICLLTLSGVAQVTFKYHPDAHVCDTTWYVVKFVVTNDTFNFNLSAMVINGTDTLSLPYPNCSSGLSGANPVRPTLDSVLITDPVCTGKGLNFQLVSVDSNTFNSFITILPCSTNTFNVTIKYHIALDCSLIPDSAIANQQQFELIQTILVDTLSGSFSGSDTVSVLTPHFPVLGSNVSILQIMGKQLLLFTSMLTMVLMRL